MNNDFDKMNADELRDYICKFAVVVNEYDRMRDEELEFINEHPNREMWDDEQTNYYDELVKDIGDKYDVIREFFCKIDPVKYFPF